MPVLLPRVLFTPDGFDDVLAIEHSDEAIDARRIVQQLGLVPLHEATGDHDALDLAGFLQLDRVADLLQALVLRRFKKPAGVDDNRVGRFRVRRDRQAVLREQT